MTVKNPEYLLSIRVHCIALHCISIELFVLSSNVQANIKRMILQINNNTDRSAVACDAFHFGKLMHSKYCYSGRLQCRTELKLWSALIWIMLILRLFFSVFLLALSLSVCVCLFVLFPFYSVLVVRFFVCRDYFQLFTP